MPWKESAPKEMLEDLHGNPIEEPKPLLQDVGIKAQLVLPAAFLKAFTRYTCKNKGKSHDPATLRRFAETYKIRWRDARKCRGARTLKQCVQRFTDLNDLFTRKIHRRLTRVPIALKRRPDMVVSPAESRMRSIPTDGRRFSIKSASYTTPELLGKPAAAWLGQPRTLLVFRLAPSDYHRFHAPVDGVIESIHTIPGDYYSVDKFMLDRRPVLQRNVRTVVCIHMLTGAKLVMVIVGATCVGSIEMRVSVGQTIHKGDDMGDFKFGGSCVTLVSNTAMAVHEVIQTRSREHQETYVRVGEAISTMTSASP